MSADPPAPGPARHAVPFGAVAALLLLALVSVAAGRQTLTFASYVVSTPTLVFLVTYGFLGTKLAMDLAPRLPDPRAWWSRGTDRQWLAFGILSLPALAAAFRLFVLRSLPVTDDEKAYGFSGKLLALGKLWVPSEELPLFFDQTFVVNDGRMFSQYFLGWPALQLPARLAGLDTGFLNSLYLAALGPAVYLAVRRAADERAARLALTLLATSPLVVFFGATELSHTTEMIALAWALWATLAARERSAPLWVDAAAAAAISVAFWIRPSVALGQGGPLVVWWLLSLRERFDLRRVLAFALPATLAATAFLWTNQALYGGVLRSGYHAYHQYCLDNEGRFGIVYPDLLSPGMLVATKFAALLRVNAATFGWPCSFLFLRDVRAWGVFASMALGHVLVHLPVDPGVESIGPTHFAELAVPLTCWTACVLSRAPEHLRVALLSAGFALSVYVPAWSSALRESQTDLTAWVGAADAVRRPAVIFHVGHSCSSVTPQSWVFSPPLYDPERRDAVLWVHHLTLASDRHLMARRFPDRTGYVFQWNPDCTYDLRELSDPTLRVPDVGIELEARYLP